MVLDTAVRIQVEALVQHLLATQVNENKYFYLNLKLSFILARNCSQNTVVQIIFPDSSQLKSDFKVQFHETIFLCSLFIWEEE